MSSCLYGRSLDDIKKSRELRFCLVPIHPSLVRVFPEGCREKCTFKGPAHEASLAFGRFLGMDIIPKFKRIGWGDQFTNSQGKLIHEATYTPSLLESGECDLFPNNLEKNDWRTRKMDFVMMFPNRLMVLVHKNNKHNYRSHNGLSGKTAVVERNTSFHTWLQQQNKGLLKATPVNIRLFPTIQALDMINQQQADFTIIDADAAIWTTRYDYPNLIAVLPVGQMKQIGWMMRKKDKELKAAVNTFFIEQRKKPQSVLNRTWKFYYDMTMTDFIRLVSMIK